MYLFRTQQCFHPRQVEKMTIVFHCHRPLVFKNVKLLFFPLLSRSCRRVIVQSPYQAQEARFLVHVLAAIYSGAATALNLCISGAQSEHL